MRSALKKLFLLLTIIITSFLLIIPTTQTSNAVESEEIPSWITNNAGWWAEGKITDTTFISGIQWLITNNVISVSPTELSAKSGYEIPSWIKNNAGWWAEGLIPDSAFISGLEWLIEHGIIVIGIHENVDPFDITFASFLPDMKQKNLQYISSTFFHIFGDVDTLQSIDGKTYWGRAYLGMNNDLLDEYNEVGIWNDSQKAVVVFPHFTSSAYDEPGFYTYFRGECDECTTTKLTTGSLKYTASGNALQALSLMGYNITTDVIVDTNPSILNQYDKVIMLHNEYVTQTMFDAITNHPKVIYLYPNALYAEIEVDYDAMTITLIRGHDYPPEDPVANGFDWEFENTHPYEYDTACNNMEFYEIDNGWMTNCYPEMVFTNSKEITYEILKTIKKL